MNAKPKIKPTSSADVAVRITDDSLAHGLAKTELQRLRHLGKAVHHKLQGRNAQSGIDLLRKTFGALVLSELMCKPYGSRSKACALVMGAPDDGGTGLCITLWECLGTRWSALRSYVVVERHAVARVFQRSLGRGDVRAASQILAGHAVIAMSLRASNRFAGSTMTREGALLWSLDASTKHFVGKTWIGIEGMFDAALRRHCLSLEEGVCAYYPDDVRKVPWSEEATAANEDAELTACATV